MGGDIVKGVGLNGWCSTRCDAVGEISKVAIHKRDVGKSKPLGESLGLRYVGWIEVHPNELTLWVDGSELAKAESHPAAKFKVSELMAIMTWGLMRLNECGKIKPVRSKFPVEATAIGCAGVIAVVPHYGRELVEDSGPRSEDNLLRVASRCRHC
jgi:hypothetical protein